MKDQLYVRFGGHWSERKRLAIAKAKELGTFGKVDRSAQYPENDPELRSGPALVRSDNCQWAEVRRLKNLQMRNDLLVLAAGAAIAHGAQTLRWLGQLHWVGRVLH